MRSIIPDKADHTLVWLAAYSYFDDKSYWFKLGTRLARLTAPVQ